MQTKRDARPVWWSKISKDVIQKAGNQCQWCGLTDGRIGLRVGSRFIECPDLQNGTDYRGYKVVKIVLSVMPMDENYFNGDLDNLRALCQQCQSDYLMGRALGESRMASGVT